MMIVRMLMLVASFTVLGAGFAQGEGMDALNQMHEQWQMHYNAGDVEALAGLYAEDASIMPPNAAETTGRESLSATAQGYIDAGAVRIDLPGFTDAAMEGDVAWASSDYTFYDSEGNLVDEGKSLVAYERIDGEWRIVRHMWNSDLPPMQASDATGD